MCKFKNFYKIIINLSFNLVVKQSLDLLKRGPELNVLCVSVCVSVCFSPNPCLVIL